ncbi:glycosyltransferase [Azospirillum sp.]|uniref:glycosyltransferase n=1 Tax=Azospirillum sp. TaxID=34012 RepID=UPI003428D26B
MANWREKVLSEVVPDPDSIHFLGKVPYDQLLGNLRLSSAHVYLTYPFVLSWSLLEAMACGAVVIGSATQPVEEVIEDGRNGLLVDFFDAKAVTDHVVEALERASDDPGSLMALRAAARRTVVERFDLSRVCLPAQVGLIADLHAGRRSSVPDVKTPARIGP